LVEILFHVVPLSVLLVPLAFINDPRGRDRLVYGALAATALLEPAYQTLLPSSSWSRPAVAFISVHVLAFNAVELWLFRSYDFVTMYGFRLLYYLVWHETWGAWRLEILF
jgi:hypothetical protein